MSAPPQSRLGPTPLAPLARSSRRRALARWAMSGSALLHLLLLYLAARHPAPPPERPPPMEVELFAPDKTPKEARALALPSPVAPDPAAPSQPARAKPPEERKAAPKPAEPEKPEALAKLEPPKPKPKPPEPDKPEPAKPIPPQPIPRLKMVEVNTPASDRPPDHARFLSDKDRRVERETRAQHTNLVKDHPKPEPFSEPNPSKAAQPGAKKERIAEDRPQKARPGAEKSRPEQASRPPLLTMRGPPRPASPSPREPSPASARPAPNGLRPALPSSAAPRPPQQTSATGRLELRPDYRAFDRIFGQQGAKEREIARLSKRETSAGAGGFQKKWQRIRSALENFVPEVQPGNQTALGTRAHPFALFIARMHRKIHKLWGFGFLVDLDGKPDGNAMNDMSLWTTVEVVVNPDGQVAKATIVRPSGVLTYDVAALDTVFSGGPYGETPRAIRSADGKVYLHWRFHRDHRQCGTFGVDPYILTTPPKGPIDTNPAEVKQETSPRVLRRLNRPPPRGPVQVPMGPLGSGGAGGDAPAAPKRPAAPKSQAPTGGGGPVVSSRDPAAERVARAFLAALGAGDAKRMAEQAGGPFLAQGRAVTRSRAELERMLKDLVTELPDRRLVGMRLLTAMEARQQLGELPPGMSYGTPMLASHATLGRTRLVLLLEQRKGRWLVVGINR
ncbi:MAG: hypothetical protein IT371_13990 [Deltaproteobacteria bacterium]|nr:hypothetical protein [Deltaproteobacteria bacterium]